MAADSKRRSYSFFIFRAGTGIHSQGSAGRPNIINGNLPLIKRVAATLKCEVSGWQVLQKRYSGTFNELAVYKFTTADSGLPERHIENMVEPKRNQARSRSP